MEIYLYSRCTSCRNAERLLQETGKAYLRRDYFRERFTSQELRALLDRAGLGVSDALSTRSRAYTALKLAERHLGDDEILDLIVREPTLLRRPLVLGNGQAVVGFNASAIRALIEQS